MKEMHMTRTSFNKKIKEGKFNVDELERLFEIINIDAMEDKVLVELSEEAEREGNFVQYGGMKKLLTFF